MIPREVPSMRPMLAPFVLMACISLPLGRTVADGARRAPRKIPKIEIKLSGPETIRPSESLEIQQFKALLINRSAEPLVLFVRNGYLLNARWNWTVTDDKGLPVGMELVLHGMCGTVPYDPNWRQLHDSDVFLLGPGESREFPIPGGPSDDYVFPRAGTYHLSMALLYVPPNAKDYFDEHGKRAPANSFEQWDTTQLSPDNFALLQNSLSVLGTSDNWNLVLPSKRRNPDSHPVFFLAKPI